MSQPPVPSPIPSASSAPLDNPGAAGAPASVVVRGLRYSYPDGRLALLGIDLEVARGESVALVGPNGAGKSTLLLHLNGLLPGRGGGGSGLGHHGSGASEAAKPGGPAVWIDGLEVNARNGPEVRRRVGLLFQDPDDQLFAPTVLDDVAFGPLNLGRKRPEARRIAEESLASVGLAGFGERLPHRLSFGERKRACLAGVLACGPTVLALDEPSANLDPRARRLLIEVLRGLPAAKLVATHDLEMALELCPRAVLLDAGQVVAAGPTPELLADRALVEAHGLEVPASLARRDGP